MPADASYSGAHLPLFQFGKSLPIKYESSLRCSSTDSGRGFFAFAFDRLATLFFFPASRRTVSPHFAVVVFCVTFVFLVAARSPPDIIATGAKSPQSRNNRRTTMVAKAVVISPVLALAAQLMQTALSGCLGISPRTI